jgi:ferric-dicitrate binding protein FerR (iron transport regulator)
MLATDREVRMRLFRRQEARDVIRREATEWIRQLAASDVTEDDKARFDAWLETSKEHEHQFLIASAFMELTGRSRAPSWFRCPRCCAYLIAVVCLVAVVIGAVIACVRA